MDSKHIRQRIKLIPEGLPLNLETMSIRMDDSGKLLVIGTTEIFYLENVEKSKILKELYNLKDAFIKLRKSFCEMNDIIIANNLKIEYHLQYDTGKSGITLCSEIDKDLFWYI